MPKLQSFLPTVAALIAFILSMLCLLAGNKPNFQTGCDVLTLFTPNVGNGAGVHDFYSIYVTSYCEGSLGPGGKGRNTTACFNHTIPFSFDPTEALRHDAPDDTSLSGLDWPDAINGDFHAFVLTSRTMTVLYCIGTGLTGIGILTKLGLTIARMRQRSMVDVSFFLTSFTSLGIASIIASVTSFELVDLINYHGKELGVSAKYGQKFIGMTWAAVALLLIGSIQSLALTFVDHERQGNALPDEPAIEKGG